MASAREPKNPLEKLDLLHADPPNTARIDAVAVKLCAEGRHAEAVDYIEITRDPALVQLLEDRALETGSPFLLQQVERLRGEGAGEDKWRKVSAAAQGHEHWMDAVRALTAAGLEEEAEALRVEKCPEFEPFKPQNK